ANGSTRYRWHIARADRLPRRIEQVVDAGALTGALTWDLTNVRTGVNLPASAFELTAPAGYEINDTTIAARPRQAPAAEPPAAGQPNAPAPQPDPRSVGPKPARISTVEMAPHFELESLAGGQITLEDLRGKIVLLDFWGTWCLPCKKASPFIQELHEDYADKRVAVYALAFRSPDDDVRAYFEDHKYTYGSLLQADDVVRDYKVRAFPTYVLLGIHGQEIARFVGGKPEETFAEIRATIDQHLAELGG
ncbi:MAG: TlpA disulfide reductase family protein, partial [Planctomycetota bacterium]